MPSSSLSEVTIQLRYRSFRIRVFPVDHLATTIQPNHRQTKHGKTKTPRIRIRPRTDRVSFGRLLRHPDRKWIGLFLWCPHGRAVANCCENILLNLTRIKSSKHPLDGSSVTMTYGVRAVTTPFSRSTFSLENVAILSALATNSLRWASDDNSCRTVSETRTGDWPGLVSRPRHTSLRAPALWH